MYIYSEDCSDVERLTKAVNYHVYSQGFLNSAGWWKVCERGRKFSIVKFYLGKFKPPPKNILISTISSTARPLRQTVQKICPHAQIMQK
jgi:hypothetical protein